MKQNKYKAIPVNPNNMGENRVKWTDRIFFWYLLNKRIKQLLYNCKLYFCDEIKKDCMKDFILVKRNFVRDDDDVILR